MKRFAAAALALALFGAAAQAHAATVDWTLSDVTFNDGTTLEGTFESDSLTGLVTGFDLTTHDGTLPGLHYDSASDVLQNNHFATDSFIAFRPTAQQYVQLAFAQPLLTGGTIALRAGGFDSYECDNCLTIRLVTGGSASAASSAPEPATWAMMLIGFGALGGVLRVRREERTRLAT